MEIEKVVDEKFREIVESGIVEKMIKARLEETIGKVIEDLLRSYSDFGKMLKEKITQALSLNNMDLTLPSYNQLVCNWVTEIVNDQIIKSGKEQIQKNLNQFFKPLEKSEYKITEIIEAFKASLSDESSHEITFIADEPSTGITSGYRHFAFDDELDKKMYECDYRLSITPEGELFSINIKGTSGKDIKYEIGYGFDAFLFQLFAGAVKIIDDSDDVDISFYCD